MGRIFPSKLRPGDKVGIVSPSFAAPGVAPAIHEQAMSRLRADFGLVPVEYPTTRNVGASPKERAADINSAWRDPDIRALLATIGGDDQICVVPFLDREAAIRDPKPFLGYSDNTNILSWLWNIGVAAFYGGSTQVQIGAGPSIDACHRAALKAILFDGGWLEITDPGESEDVGKDWSDPAALTSFGVRESTEDWMWFGPERTVTGPTWGGCLEVLQGILLAGRFPVESDCLKGGVLLLETSDGLIPPGEFRRVLRAMGERGLLRAVDGILIGRPPASNFLTTPSAGDRKRYRDMLWEYAVEQISHYNPDAVVCFGPPFGHTRPQWILPYGGEVTIDTSRRKILANYG